MRSIIFRKDISHPTICYSGTNLSLIRNNYSHHLSSASYISHLKASHLLKREPLWCGIYKCWKLVVQCCLLIISTGDRSRPQCRLQTLQPRFTDTWRILELNCWIVGSARILVLLEEKLQISYLKTLSNETGADILIILTFKSETLRWEVFGVKGGYLGYFIF